MESLVVFTFLLIRIMCRYLHLLFLISLSAAMEHTEGDPVVFLAFKVSLLTSFLQKFPAFEVLYTIWLRGVIQKARILAFVELSWFPIACRDMNRWAIWCSLPVCVWCRFRFGLVVSALYAVLCSAVRITTSWAQLPYCQYQNKELSLGRPVNVFGIRGRA